MGGVTKFSFQIYFNYSNCGMKSKQRRPKSLAGSASDPIEEGKLFFILQQLIKLIVDTHLVIYFCFASINQKNCIRFVVIFGYCILFMNTEKDMKKRSSQIDFSAACGL